MTGKRWPGKEVPKWGIRHNNRKKDFDLEGVSGKVIVRDGTDIGICRIRFSEEFVESLGHYLPYGISSTFPVFLRLTRKMEGLAWYVAASYFHLPSREHDLWTLGEHMPDWAKVKWHEYDDKKADPQENWTHGQIRPATRRRAKKAT